MTLLVSVIQEGKSPAKMEYRFEFDRENEILLPRLERRLTDELTSELYWAVRMYSIMTDARAGICDLSPVTEFTVSPEMIFDLVNREPAMPDATTRRRFIVAPAMLGQCLSHLLSSRQATAIGTAAKLLHRPAMNYVAVAGPSFRLSKHPPKLSQEKNIGRSAFSFLAGAARDQNRQILLRGNRDES
jgi:hypothetical protein